MTSVAVVGVGAIGGTVVTHLAEAGCCEVVACVRTPIPELAVERLSGMELRPVVRQETDADKVGVVDWVVLATKAHQTSKAAPWLAALTGPATRIAVLQNGVEHRERVVPLVAGRVVPVTPQVVELGLALIEEARDIGRALGARLPDDLPATILAKLQASPPESGSSMLWDRLAGRPLEYDARNGAVVRASDRTGIPAPCNRTVNALLAAVSGLPV